MAFDEVYLLSFTRETDTSLVTLDKSNATGYNPGSGAYLFAESEQPVIVIPAK